ncbi:MAG: hypothetical protein M5R42_03030 [Rhodocyclaceae bacterium]|nr:hypothetical protein [Rhodocyclaceae bacterium]
MNRVKLERLTTAVQANCDIADARHAREMTMCNYLLAMRELYRWEAGLPLRQPLKQAELSAWIARREALWNELEDAEFRPLPIGGGCDPFDNAAINDALAPQGLVYAGGLGRWGKPHFFLGELARQETRHGLTVLVSDREHARDLFAPPAALREGLVFLRLDALRRWLWEKTEIWGVRQADGALKAALDGYGFADDAEAALERMAARESEVLILHEVGEGMAEPLLGADWRAIAGQPVTAACRVAGARRARPLGGLPVHPAGAARAWRRTFHPFLLRQLRWIAPQPLSAIDRSLCNLAENG